MNTWVRFASVKPKQNNSRGVTGDLETERLEHGGEQGGGHRRFCPEDRQGRDAPFGRAVRQGSQTGYAPYGPLSAPPMSQASGRGHRTNECAGNRRPGQWWRSRIFSSSMVVQCYATLINGERAGRCASTTKSRIRQVTPTTFLYFGIPRRQSL